MWPQTRLMGGGGAGVVWVELINPCIIFTPYLYLDRDTNSKSYATTYYRTVELQTR